MISLGIFRQSDASEFSSSGQFDPLAIEIIENIFICLPKRDLITILRLNKRLNTVILNSTELQYRIALCAYGMVDGHSSMSAKDKLAELLRREKSWPTLKLSKQICESGQYYASSIFRFQDGVLVEDIEGSGEDDWNLRVIDFSSCQNHKDDSRDFRNLPAFRGRLLAAGLTVHEYDLICFVIAQEMSVLFNSLPMSALILCFFSAEFENKIIVHLRQYSTRDFHPLTVKAEISIEYAGLDILRFSAQVEIVGQWLVLLLSEDRSIADNLDDIDVGELLLIHWPSGDIVIVSLWRLVSAFLLR